MAGVVVVGHDVVVVGRGQTSPEHKVSLGYAYKPIKLYCKVYIT